MFRIGRLHIAGVLVVVSLTLAACGGPSNPTPASGSFEPAATRLPSITQPQGIENADSRPAPVLALKDVAGKTVSLIDYKGRAVLVNFWATWCAPCRAEMPHLVAAYEKHKAEGFMLLGINATQQDDPGAIAPYMKEFGMTFPVLLDPDGSAQRAFRLRGLPTSYFIDRQGIIKSTYTGTMTPEIIEERIGAIVGS